MSIRRQFILVFVLFALALTALGGWAAWAVTSRVLENELDEKLVLVGSAAAAVGLEGDLAVVLEPGDLGLDIYRQRLTDLSRYVAEAYIFRRDGTLVVSSEGVEQAPVGAPLRAIEPYTEELGRAWSAGQATTPLFQGLDERHYKYGFVRLGESDAMLAVLMPADFLEPLASFRRTVIYGSLGAAVIAVLLAVGLATTIVKPLESLSHVALRIQRGRLDEAVETTRGDEIGRLARAMERMRRGILERDEQLRLMLSQVAHEIRNPLGGVELFATAAAESEDPAERRRMLERVRTEVSALNRIIGDFLMFGRPRAPEPTRHDIRGPLREAADLARKEIEARNGHLEVDLPASAVDVRADPDHMKRVALNLLRNAGQWGTRVALGLVKRDGEVVISVQDDGPGVPAEIRDRIFEPFVSGKEKGAGLGLAIVRSLVEANGGRVELVQRNSGAGGVGQGEDAGRARAGSRNEARREAVSGNRRPEANANVGKGAEFRVYFKAVGE
ncbi:MAG: HAMP domain-containing histidine kinase [Gemmatimonadetes bacterium]|nr:HAMP domain-containing histidine kinase [Gemmatimonadota bacterium]